MLFYWLRYGVVKPWFKSWLPCWQKVYIDLFFCKEPQWVMKLTKELLSFPGILLNGGSHISHINNFILNVINILGFWIREYPLVGSDISLNLLVLRDKIRACSFDMITTNRKSTGRKAFWCIWKYLNNCGPKSFEVWFDLTNLLL